MQAYLLGNRRWLQPPARLWSQMALSLLLLLGSGWAFVRPANAAALMEDNAYPHIDTNTATNTDRAAGDDFASSGADPIFLVSDPAVDSSTTNFATDVPARYVRVQSRGANALSLAAVHLWSLSDTDVILDGSGQLTIIDINGGASNDTVTLSINGAYLRVSDPGNLLAGSGTGVVQVNDNTVDVPLANITAGIVIDTADGTDTVHLNAALDLGSGNLEVAAQAIIVNAPVTVSGSAVISMTARQTMILNGGGNLVSEDGDIRLRANQGAVPVVGGYDGLTVNARIAATGSGNIELYGRGGTISEVRRGITFQSNSRIETVSGNITLHGQGGSGGGYSHGIDGGGQIASSGGAISITGSGGENGGPNRGIRFTSMVITNTVGAISLNGVGGASGSENTGVLLESVNNRIETDGGPITFDGQGGAGGNSSFGVQIQADVTSTGGNISLTGVGGGGSNNAGVLLQGGRLLSTTLTGAIVISGTGGTGGEANIGVRILDAGTTVQTDGGDITIRGASNATSGNHNYGIQSQGQVTSNSGDVSLTGVGGGGDSYQQGIVVSIGQVTSNGGDLTFTGRGGSGPESPGVHLSDSAIVSTTLTGAITISGTGGTGGGVNMGIRILGTNTKVQTVGGDIILHGVSNSLSGDWNTGIQSQGQVTSNGGHISFTGSGGGGGAYAHGVLLQDNAIVATTLAGTITISGTGGTGSTDNMGVRVVNANTTVQTDGGDITIQGVSNGTNGNWNLGIQHQGQVMSNGGNLSLTGSGGGGSQYGAGIYLDSSGQLSTTLTGIITINGTGGTATNGDNWGVRIFGASSKVQTDQGDIIIFGVSNATTGNYNLGVEVNGAQVTSNSGDLTLNGNGGAGGSNNVGLATYQGQIASNGGNIDLTGISGGGTNTNMGVRFTGGTTVFTTLTGDLTINGVGGDGTEGYNFGIELRDGSQLQVADGSLTLTGVGGAGTSHGLGINLENSTLSSTGSGPSVGAVTLYGTGGPSATSDNYGIKIYGGQINTVAGELQITGIGGASASGNGWGLIMEGAAQISSAGAGQNAAGITITGAAASGSAAYGILSGWAGSTISTVDGALTLNGTSTSAESGSIGLHLWPGVVRSTGSGDLTLTGSAVNGSDVYLNGTTVDSGSADVTINANTIDLWGNAISGSGQLLIRPRTPETTIGLGGGDGTLNLDDGELSRLTDGFAGITIGDVANGTGTVTIDSTTFNDPVTVAGGVIRNSAWATPDIDAGANAVILDGNVSPAPEPEWNDTLDLTGNVTLAANHTFTVEVFGSWSSGYDQLNVVGSVTISDNVALTTVAPSGFIPDGADTLTIINNDGSDAVVGTFAGLPEGATLPNFIGSGMDATISYSGGDGNDVVITVWGPEISLWGNGESIGQGCDCPYRGNHTDFGRVKVDGGTVVRTFTISNTGNLPLNLDGSPLVALSGPDAAAFSVTAAPSNPVAVGTGTTFQITFDPSATGTVTATVSIASDDSNEDPYAFEIKGAGVIPNVSFNGVDCDLIEAINAANSDAPSNDCPAGSSVVTDTITLLSDVVLTDEYNYSDNGLPVIESAIIIEGAGYTISRTVDAPEFRFFEVDSSGDLTLNALTLQNGGGSDFGEYGGAIYTEGRLTVNSSVFRVNSVEYYGGAIYSEYNISTVINNSTFSGNTTYYGGALYAYYAMLTVNNSTFDDNQAEYGSVLYNDYESATEITNSTFSDNSAEDSGGAIYNYYATLTITNSTFSGNSADYYGGAIYNYEAILTITNSTFSGNSAEDYGGAIYSEYGGAIALNNSTFSGNSADDGGAIYIYDTPLTLNRSLLAGNSAGYATEIYNDGGTVNADSFNLFGDSSKVNAQALYGFTPGATDITATSDGTTPTALANILNATLADNGGPATGSGAATETNALVAGSPAIDAAGDSGLHTDQRGVARPQGAADDIGAFELAAVAAPEIDVTGNGVLIASGDITPDTADHTDFGSADIDGGTVVRTFTISNTGDADLTDIVVQLQSVSPTLQAAGAVVSPFSVTGIPATTVAPGESTTFAITFDPTEVGAQTNQVLVFSNDDDEVPYSFAISGTGSERLLPTTHLSAGAAATQSCTDGSPGYVRDCTVTFNLNNSSGGTLFIGHYRVNSISAHAYVLNGEPTPGQDGTTVQAGEFVNAGDTFQPEFVIGLTSTARYSIRYSVFGVATIPDARIDTTTDELVELGTFDVTFDPNVENQSFQLYLPTVMNQ